MDKSDDPIIPLPLSVVIDLFLGDRHYGEWPAKHLKWLEPIKVLSKNTFICHIREADEFDPFIKTPIIYRYARWKESSDLWLKQKARSERERQDRFVFQRNDSSGSGPGFSFPSGISECLYPDRRIDRFCRALSQACVFAP